jgi:hypothetical protein
MTNISDKDLKNIIKINIHNLTARRIGIGIKKNPESGELFVLPPFGRRSFKGDELDKIDQLNYESWEQLNLIKIEYDKLEEKAKNNTFHLTPENIDKVKRTSNTIFQWLEQKIILIVILAVGIALVFIFSRFDLSGFGIDIKNIDLLTNKFFLFHLLQLLFISIASLLPALMYFMFTKSKLYTLKESFFRDIVHLDPRVVTLDDAKSLYENKVNSVYGSEESSGSRLLYDIQYPIIIATLLITIGWILTLQPFVDIADTTDPIGILFSIEEEKPLVFGFLGAYFFGITMLFSRYVRSDLRPKAYTHITVRILTVIILIWVLSVLDWNYLLPIDTVSKDHVLLPLAFLVGIFPEIGIAWIFESINVISRYFGIILSKINITSKDEKTLINLDGINMYHRAQFLEEGIDNIENLAHHDLIDLMLQTRIPLPRLVDWIDQAILHLHVENTEMKDGKLEDSLKNLRKYGIRTATDLENAYEAAKELKQENELLTLLEGNGSFSGESGGHRLLNGFVLY